MQKVGQLLTVLRYVERNPARAGLVGRTEDWPWSSLGTADAPALHPGPVPRPANWRHWVNEADDPGQLAALRNSVNRGAPWGGPGWAGRTAARLGIEASLRPRGRPRKGNRP